MELWVIGRASLRTPKGCYSLFVKKKMNSLQKKLQKNYKKIVE